MPEQVEAPEGGCGPWEAHAGASSWPDRWTREEGSPCQGSNYAKNPFNFKHYDINFVALYVDGEQLPVKLLQPDFENGCYVRKYMQLIQTVSSHMEDHSLLVDIRIIESSSLLLAGLPKTKSYD
ncbi:hypothetical protein GRJ2_003141700 [Grus japonensis]|uniref:Uncharacterized protein n=1 Tax=Grus japonensis TaxID=30415 RepID=A0ABC9YB26_GRUJA